MKIQDYILLFFLTFFSLYTLSAQDYTIDAFEVRIEIDEEGLTHVEETISVDFNEKRRGIYRNIPYIFTVNGESYKTKISNIEVPSHKAKISRKGTDVIIRMGDKDVYVTGRQTYQIKYTVEDAYVAYEDHQEFYWNITGNDTKTTTDHASFTIQLPKPIQLAKDDLRIFTGEEGSTANKGRIVQIDERTIKGANMQPLQSQEGMTVALRLPTGYLENVNRITALGVEEKERSKDTPIWTLIPAALMFAFFTFWRNLRNRIKGSSTINEEFYPPEGLTSAHVGAFIDHTANDRDLISLIPYWGTEGYIKVLQSGDSTILEKIKDLPLDFPTYELTFFNEVFKDGDTVYVSSFKEKFYTTFLKIKAQLSREIKEQGYYDENYQSVFRTWKWWLGIFAVAILGVLSIVIYKFLYFGIGLVVFALFAMIVSLFRSPLSERGYEIHDKLIGLRSFLKNPDAQQIKLLMEENPKYFEMMLPYAVAFGIDKSFTKTFDTYFDYAPYWYYTMGYHNRPTFSTFTESFTPKEISSAFAAAPHSSGGSSGGGFSGGSSGGGFGGGGTGSW